MVTIRFPDRETEQEGLGFLLERFSCRVLGNGEHIVPEAALKALTKAKISFTVVGKTTYEQEIECLVSVLRGQQICRDRWTCLLLPLDGSGVSLFR